MKDGSETKQIVDWEIIGKTNIMDQKEKKLSLL